MFLKFPPSLLVGGAFSDLPCLRWGWIGPVHSSSPTLLGNLVSVSWVGGVVLGVARLWGLPLLPQCLTVSLALLAASSAAVSSGPLPEAEQAWPQSSGEEELQLQLALAMSKEEADQVPWPLGPT